MKFATFYQQGNDEGLKEKVEAWIKDNEDNILEIVDVEYEYSNNTYMAIITYLD
ncbi:hypothetical protein [Paratissierella segnis]|jgi:predicted phosphoadenosine phosphosulfate sulfurtransferase|uniref:Sporulation protein Cse60 n=1 Tax=Paratissierella segnis TaxID=2763679 RepID=A0A926IJ28_9FIRM|nr:hypothetical protein [Paratissierella segnis]MBC8586800.1 hypothetical protein [Paratissierella segnis]